MPLTVLGLRRSIRVTTLPEGATEPYLYIKQWGLAEQKVLKLVPSYMREAKSRLPVYIFDIGNLEVQGESKGAAAAANRCVQLANFSFLQSRFGT